MDIKSEQTLEGIKITVTSELTEEEIEVIKIKYIIEKLNEINRSGNNK